MNHRSINRRSFGLSLAAATGLAQSARQKIRLGGPVFIKTPDPVELAREHKRLGYSAAYCPEMELEERERIAATERAFADEGIVIAEVGAWRNLLDPDAVKRKANIEYVTRRLALAEGVGARCCVDYAGSFHPDIPWGPHPRNLSDEFFDGTVQNCRTIIDAVKPRRTKFTIEMMGWLIPDGPDSYLKLIKAVDRPEFAVHMDICNGINSPVRFYNNRSFIRECFQKLGRWTVSCHAKDLEWVPEFSVRFREVAPGRGQVDYVAYLQAIAELRREAPLMLEHLPNAELYKEGADYIRATAIKAAVELV